MVFFHHTTTIAAQHPHRNESVQVRFFISIDQKKNSQLDGSVVEKYAYLFPFLGMCWLSFMHACHEACRAMPCIYFLG